MVRAGFVKEPSLRPLRQTSLGRIVAAQSHSGATRGRRGYLVGKAAKA